ncbi:hypothetical protein MCEMSEM22_03066 [Comamonadaceae bacterium]
MGISLAWIAVETLDADEALARLSLARTGQDSEFLFEGVSCHALPRGWFMVAATPCDHRIGNAQSMAAVSQGCRAVAFAVEEHVNFASTELWEDGACIWHVEHEADQGNEHIAHSGSLPPRFAELLAGVATEDNEARDAYFHMDIPIILAKEITGYRFDEINPDVDNTAFERLTDLLPKAPWWKFWR